ncbi:hypothetical protein CFD26_100552 [Aspergillus turcosus]|uniref:Uncharacterized protein n=1 Tax=Aspergillus turcosus TaxID=1245748 RepID=A0A3R7HVD7_9EURO|nr:hypothetical protein CFD26_100552 [Aspergillus turcosus]
MGVNWCIIMAGFDSNLPSACRLKNSGCNPPTTTFSFGRPRPSNYPEKDTGNEELDELDEDKEDDDIPSLTAPTWKPEMLNPREQVLLEKKSDVFDPTEMYEFRHIVEALKYVKLAPEAATPDAITHR